MLHRHWSSAPQTTIPETRLLMSGSVRWEKGKSWTRYAKGPKRRRPSKILSVVGGRRVGGGGGRGAVAAAAVAAEGHRRHLFRWH